MNSAQVDAYLRRLGVEHPAWPTVDVLRELHLRHLQSVPFENLSLHLGEPIVLGEKQLVDKLVGARRGGFCYELNGAFAALLKALGFDVTLLAGRVYGDEGRTTGIPYDHLALRVRTVDGGEWLADVGYGSLSHWPLTFGDRGEQTDSAGLFRIVEAGPDRAGVRGGSASADGDLDILKNGRPEYRLEVRPRVLADFTAGAWWHSTSPDSHFGRSLVCSRVTEEGGRITLAGRRLTATAPDGTREVRALESDAEVLGAYREWFGMVLEEVPRVRER
ncbi:arylamine N-acetyltransferase [Streptomyces sp. NPDC093252]|uniref:arylamine N-acetyltransferase family protein n=1 Tax=Streptomyces sp. NPDC093252 TaxID=3154980 RepID=UPI00344A500C